MCLSILPLVTNAQEKSERQKEKYLEKVKAERQKKAEKQYQEAVKNHYDMQSPETRKMMRQTFKKSQREGKPKFFLARWYGNIFHKSRFQKNNQNKGPILRPKAFIIPYHLYRNLG